MYIWSGIITNIFIQARHALTADSKFGWVSNTTGFSYLTFYDIIIKNVSGWPQTEKTRLVQWWNR
jgi:hypothetical protein